MKDLYWAKVEASDTENEDKMKIMLYNWQYQQCGVIPVYDDRTSIREFSNFNRVGDGYNVNICKILIHHTHTLISL